MLASGDGDMAETTPFSAEQYPSAKRRRRNVARACDSCKAKKTRCNGVQPCSRCEALQLRCNYVTAYSRGLFPPAIPAVPPHRRTASEPKTRSTIPRKLPTTQQSPYTSPSAKRLEHDTQSPGRIGQQENNGSLGLVREASRTPDAEEERVEGLIGASSNMAYSHAARLQLVSQPPSPPRPSHQATSLGEAHHSPPLEASAGRAHRMTQRSKESGYSSLYFREPSFTPLNIARYYLPSTERGLEMTSWYFDNASPTYRFLHRPSLERMVRALCSSGTWLGRGTGIEARLTESEEGVVLMVWALGCQYALPENEKAFGLDECEWLRQKG